MSRRRAPLPLRHLVIAGLAPLVLLAAWGALLVVRTLPAHSQVRAAAPEFSLVDLDGRPISLADLRGRPVIVNFWASSCPECVEEFPLLAAAVDRHQDAGLALVGIVYRDSPEAARAFMARMSGTWPAAMDPGEAVALAYGVFGRPESFFIDRDGRIAGRQIGPLSAADLDRQLSLILDKE